ncbi:MAG: carbon-nitrogen hydrolase family protein [bacterium]|nr:carbon-nitrogen hydrolase family protein [bacterium]
MPRKITVVTICFNEEFRRNVTPEDNLNYALSLLNDVKSIKPDLVCLPEVFLETGVPKRPISDSFRDVLINSMSERAKELNSYIVIGGYEPITEGKRYNSAWLVGRDGLIIGRYDKYHPTIGEIEDYRVKPGNNIPIFETDFGKLGITICYDIGWPSLWNTLGERGAEIVIWISAYDGGFPLQVYAWSNFYYVVSSVRTNHSKIIDKTGRIISSTSRWFNITYKTIDLEKEIFHIDGQFQKLSEIQRKLGNFIIIETFSEENIFTIESNSQEWPVDRIIKEFGLERFRNYHKRAEEIQDRYR